MLCIIIPFHEAADLVAKCHLLQCTACHYMVMPFGIFHALPFIPSHAPRGWLVCQCYSLPVKNVW